MVIMIAKANTRKMVFFNKEPIEAMDVYSGRSVEPGGRRKIELTYGSYCRRT